MIGIFKHRLIVADKATNLRRRLFGREQIFRLRHIETQWITAIYELPFVNQAGAAGNQLYLRVDNPEEQNPLIVRQLVALGAEIQYIDEVTHSLEEIYLQLVSEADATIN
jgi:ABC-2 type transport system ATP-binding protein